MCDGRNLVIVEVRSRASATLARPADTITAGKRRRILRATQYLLLREPRLRGWPVRFDVVEVIGDGPRPAVAWLRAAFSGDDVPGARPPGR